MKCACLGLLASLALGNVESAKARQVASISPLEGSWQSLCVNMGDEGSTNKKIFFKGTTFKWVTSRYQDPACLQNPQDLVISGDTHTGSTTNGLTELDFMPTTAGAIPTFTVYRIEKIAGKSLLEFGALSQIKDFRPTELNPGEFFIAP